MQKLFAILCVSVSLELVYSAVYIQPAVKKPPEFACEEGCYSPELNIVLPYNEPYSPTDQGQCRQYLCGNSGDTQILTCGAVGAGPGCVKVPGDLSKPYPNCCNTVSCDPSASNGTQTAVA
ncbi:uncharacterized protein LOC135077812 [Ostrinia nubilalis]|uniref:uncharacterized protein LOC135077812 n=1 Tax=Ostrinia nubilalis TaxID=29057 RepID=UPI0030822B76